MYKRSKKMSSYQIVVTALRSLSKNKMRTILTTLGIAIGIAAIVAVMSVGEGARRRINATISSLGDNMIIVLGTSTRRNRFAGYSTVSLKKSDYATIMKECDGIKQATPSMAVQRTASFEGENWSSTITGTNEQYLQIRSWEILYGESFTKEAVQRAEKVAVLGLTPYKKLFGSGTDPIGFTIMIEKVPFTVIGVLGEKGKAPNGMDQDDVIIVPITTLQKRLFGGRRDRYGAFIFSAKNVSKMNILANEIAAILRQQHKLSKKDEDDFSIFTQDDISQASDKATQIVSLLLFIIASISLIVGGIGIMNIMLVTVSERTREIGIRMAIGATRKNILNQFVIEAIVVCLVGSLLGIAAGIALSTTLSKIMAWPSKISVSAIVTSIISSTAIGVFFGYYPARKASKLNPVEALFEQ